MLVEVPSLSHSMILTAETTFHLCKYMHRIAPTDHRISLPISQERAIIVGRPLFSRIGTFQYKIMKQSIAIFSLLIAGSSAFVPATTRTHQSFSLSSTVDDKTEVREYFNTEGFNRWNKIYSESDDVNSVQLDIRTGHDQTIQKILNWIEADGDIRGKSVCDCGCGVGSLAIPLAQMGK